MSVVVPHYASTGGGLPEIRDTGQGVRVGDLAIGIGHACHQGVDVYLLQSPAFGRSPYERDDLGTVALFCRAVVEAVRVLDLRPDLVHCHDWQTGLIPGYAKGPQGAGLGRARVLFTIHNLGYRGWFADTLYPASGLPDATHPLYADGDDGFSLLRGAIACAGPGNVNTVSPNYAREIVHTDMGWGLQGALRRCRVFGILNGIDYGRYNPEIDPHIRRRYTPQTLRDARPANKLALQQVRLADRAVGEGEEPPARQSGCGLEESPDAFVLGMIARVVQQKGLAVAVGAVRALLDEGQDLQFVFNGQPGRRGDRYCREVGQMLHQLAADHPSRLLIRFSGEFDHALGRMMYAGCDAMLCTPLYEPCGLEPMKCMRYGCVPVVYATGGLADQVQDFDPATSPEGSGFLCRCLDPETVADALRRVTRVYSTRRDVWDGLAVRNTARDYSWPRGAEEYLRWYKRLRAEHHRP